MQPTARHSAEGPGKQQALGSGHKSRRLLGSGQAPGHGRIPLGENTGWRPSREGAGAGLQGYLHGSHRGPSHLSFSPHPCPPLSPPRQLAVSSLHGAAQPWDSWGLTRKWVCLGGPRSWGPALQSQGQEEHLSRRVLPAGGHCSGHRPPKASKKMLRARAPE